MLKTGIVINVHKKYIELLTYSGEFVYVKRNKKSSIDVGAIYAGEKINRFKSLPVLLVLTCVLIVLTTFSTIYYLYTDVKATIVIKSNVSIQLQTNRWNKIVDTSALSLSSETLLDSTKLENKDINDGLIAIVKQLDRKKLLGTDRTLNIFISSSSNVDISSFERYSTKNKITFIINNNGIELTNLKK